MPPRSACSGTADDAHVRVRIGGPVLAEVEAVRRSPTEHVAAATATDGDAVVAHAVFLLVMDASLTHALPANVGRHGVIVDQADLREPQRVAAWAQPRLRAHQA
eukprot:6238383-Prymnesium_polylepis.2